MKIGCLQTDIVWENKEKNFKKVRRLIRESVNNGCELVCLPELFATGFTMNSKQFMEKIPGVTSEFLEKESRENKIYIVGTLIEKLKGERKPANTSIVYDKTGNLIARYRKIQPFTLDGEDKCYTAGDSISVFKLDDMTAGLFICHDLKFPELFTIAVSKGCNVIFVCANWPSVREEQWKTLLKARAIENQSYMIGVNRVGRSPFHNYSGASMIVGPLGNIVAERTSREGVIIGDISAEMLNEVRKDFPFLGNKKPKLYDSLRD